MKSASKWAVVISFWRIHWFLSLEATGAITTPLVGNHSLSDTNLGWSGIVHTNKDVNKNEDWRLGTNELRFSFEGVYQYVAAGKLENQHFLVPIAHDVTTRKLSSLPVQPDDGRWKRVMIEFQ